MKIGYARVSTRGQELEVQQGLLRNLGVDDVNILLDHGYTATNRNRPGLARALDRLREGDYLVVTKLDRLARSVPDAHAIAQEVTDKGAKLQLGSEVYDPNDPMGRLMFNMLSMIAQFERDLISARTREGMELARQRGRLKGKPPKLTEHQQNTVARWIRNNTMTQAEMAQTLGVAPSTITRTKKRLIDQGKIDPDELHHDWSTNNPRLSPKNPV